MGMALKLLHGCAKCGKQILVSTSDPIISAASLGPGFFHDACAKEVWANKSLQKEERAAEISEKRSVAAKARGVFRPCKSCGAKIASGKECQECLSERQAIEVEDE
jgi:hypothetical protein